MERLELRLENCHGIKALTHSLDFTGSKQFAIYAPNGSMKSSLFRTFKDLVEGKASGDVMFPDRPPVRSIKDEAGNDVSGTAIVAVEPYSESFSNDERTSTLLVDSKRRLDYETLQKTVEKEKSAFLGQIKKRSGSKKDLESEISNTFTGSQDGFFPALLEIKAEVTAQVDGPFATTPYDLIFDPKVADFLGTQDFSVALADYVAKYDELLAKSKYFSRKTFNYYNAGLVTKALDENGYFAAKHTLRLHSDTALDIGTTKDLSDLISNEKKAVTDDPELRKKFAEIEKTITKNANVRAFQAYVSDHPECLPELVNLDEFRRKVWKAYFRAHLSEFSALVTTYESVRLKKEEIELEAANQRTQWEKVIDIFNRRFTVPFKLEARNRVSMILGSAKLLQIAFTFHDGPDQTTTERDQLMRVLSTGEKKALHMLNVIFEIETRKNEGAETLFVFDDIADSFDYKNKYAIIQYLKDIGEDPRFKLLILTHNFDFFRTLESRFVRYSSCLMAVRTDEKVILQPAAGIRNVFLYDWKPNFHLSARKRVATIAFMRNLVEYTKGSEDADFLQLTSLLHWRPETTKITQADLDAVYLRLFGNVTPWESPGMKVYDLLESEAAGCVATNEPPSLENKVVLSIAIRLRAEKFMVEKINDATFHLALNSHQTAKLHNRFKRDFGTDATSLDVLDRVMIMTPENIHLNSFMYEPIIDMGDDHLRKLYADVCTLGT